MAKNLKNTEAHHKVCLWKGNSIGVAKNVIEQMGLDKGEAIHHLYKGNKELYEFDLKRAKQGKI